MRKRAAPRGDSTTYQVDSSQLVLMRQYVGCIIASRLQLLCFDCWRRNGESRTTHHMFNLLIASICLPENSSALNRASHPTRLTHTTGSAEAAEAGSASGCLSAGHTPLPGLPQLQGLQRKLETRKKKKGGGGGIGQKGYYNAKKRAAPRGDGAT